MDNQHNEEELTPQESLKLITKMIDKVQDDALWKLAKKRASFKLALIVFVLINAMLTGIWYFTSGPRSYFWPGWCLFGWGLGMVFMYIDAYISNGIFSEEKEFERLKEKQKSSNAKG